MANIFYNDAKLGVWDRSIDLLANNLDVMLLVAGYTPDADHLVVDAGGADDPVDHELAVTGYAGGWGGSGRKVLASKALAKDNTTDKAFFDAADVSWASLATGATIVAALLIKRGSANDTTARLIAYIDLADTPTNGSPFTLQFPAAGILTY